MLAYRGIQNTLGSVSPIVPFFLAFTLIKSDVTGGLKPEELDSFHELILVDELSRVGAGGVVCGLLGGLSIGLPPVSFLNPSTQVNIL